MATAASLGEPFLSRLPVTGVSITVFNQAGQQSTIHASDTTAGQLDECQFDLGEGPVFEALRSMRPVLLPDLDEIGSGEWPLFGRAVSELPVGALFAFPMAMGAACVGVVCLYRSTRGELSEAAAATATSLARSIAGPALRRAVRSAEGEAAEGDRAVELRREVHQATGMVLAQLNTSATEAFSRLRAYAFSNTCTVQQVATEVIAHRLDFSELAEE